MPNIGSKPKLKSKLLGKKPTDTAVSLKGSTKIVGETHRDLTADLIGNRHKDGGDDSLDLLTLALQALGSKSISKEPAKKPILKPFLPNVAQPMLESAIPSTVATILSSTEKPIPTNKQDWSISQLIPQSHTAFQFNDPSPDDIIAQSRGK